MPTSLTLIHNANSVMSRFRSTRSVPLSLRSAPTSPRRVSTSPLNSMRKVEIVLAISAFSAFRGAETRQAA